MHAKSSGVTAPPENNSLRRVPPWGIFLGYPPGLGPPSPWAAPPVAPAGSVSLGHTLGVFAARSAALFSMHAKSSDVTAPSETNSLPRVPPWGIFLGYPPEPGPPSPWAVPPVVPAGDVSLGHKLGIFAARSAALFFMRGGGFTPGFDAKIAARGRGSGEFGHKSATRGH